MSELKQNRFSIIVPVKAFNDYCQESLSTCRRLYPDQQLLFSPDEPTQMPIEGVEVVPSGKHGPGYKRDLCAQKAKGDILAFLDDDAYPIEGWLETADRLFDDPNVGAVGGPAVTPNSDGRRRWASGLVFSSLMAGGPYQYRYIPQAQREVDDYPTCNLLVRRDVFEKIGGFDTRYWPGEDTVACLKIVHELKMKILYHPGVFVYHHRRDLYAGHLRQVNNYARHRGYFVKKFPQTSLRLSYFIPSLFLAGVALGWLPAVWWRPWAIIWAAGLGLYMILVLLSALKSGGQAPADRRGPGLFWLVATGIVVTHLSYGLNFLVGLFAPMMREEKTGAQ